VCNREGQEKQVTEVRDVIIIGSGPAGYTAALYAARGRLNPLLFEGSVTSGGALMNTTDVENFPGFPDGILGPELMDSIRKQAERFGAELVSDDVTEVDLRVNPKVVKVGEDVHLARTVIIATGSRYRELGVPGEKRLAGHGVSWCATCDGFFFRDGEIAVIGGGDSAIEEATFLTRFAKTVTVVHRRDKLRASKIMQQRAMNNPKVKFAWNSEVTEVLGEDRVSGLRLRDTETGEERTLPVTGMFVAIGHDPRSELFTDQLPVDSEGYLLVDPATTRTALDGVFAAGDVVDHTYRQAVTAAGTGCAAALDAERWLADHED
jgi:thioredoxin reductase (NADPH)